MASGAPPPAPWRPLARRRPRRPGTWRQRAPPRGRLAGHSGRRLRLRDRRARPRRPIVVGQSLGGLTATGSPPAGPTSSAARLSPRPTRSEATSVRSTSSRIGSVAGRCPSPRVSEPRSSSADRRSAPRPGPAGWSAAGTAGGRASTSRWSPGPCGRRRGNRSGRTGGGSSAQSWWSAPSTETYRRAWPAGWSKARRMPLSGVVDAGHDLRLDRLQEWNALLRHFFDLLG